MTIRLLLLLFALGAVPACGEDVGSDPNETRRPPRTDAGATRRPDAAMVAPDDAAVMGGDDARVVRDRDECGNGLDDDANGQVDDGCACEPGATQPCYPGNPAEAGRGACRRGAQTCTGMGEFGRWGACEGAAGPSAEACDNVDNDCDGQTDEDIAPRACMAACGAGTQACAAGAWGPCAGGAACDAGTPDAGMPPNTRCDTAIDISPRFAGDTRMVMGTTCGATDLVRLICNRGVAAPEVFYLWNSPDEPYNVRWSVTPGFTVGLAQADEACRPTTLDCETVDSSDYRHPHTLVVERIGGGCGAFTLTITRTY